MANYRETVPVWTDLATALSAWEEEFGIDIAIELRPCIVRGRADLYAEITASDRAEGSGKVLHMVRQPLNIRKLGAPIRNMMYGVFTCIEHIDATPWLWPQKVRRERVALD